MNVAGGGGQKSNCIKAKKKRLKVRNKAGENLGFWKQQTNKLPARLCFRREPRDEVQPSLPHLILPASNKDVWTLVSASLFLPIC